jgi:CRP/FNR family cyclic AMP-dependent transcriptional regulator
LRLLEHPVFKNVDTASFAGNLSSLKEKMVPKDDLVSGPGLGQRQLNLLLEGELAAYQLTADGRRLLLEIIEPGGVDGLLLMAGLHGHFTEARKPSRIAVISPHDLRSLARLQPQLALNLLQMMLSRIEKREEQLDSIVHREPGRRLARQLLALGEYLGTPQPGRILLRPRLSHQMLADMLGLRRETVTLHLNALRELGALTVEDHRLELRVEALRAIAEGTAPPPRLPNHG